MKNPITITIDRIRIAYAPATDRLTITAPHLTKAKRDLIRLRLSDALANPRYRTELDHLASAQQWLRALLAGK